MNEKIRVGVIVVGIVGIGVIGASGYLLTRNDAAGVASVDIENATSSTSTAVAQSDGDTVALFESAKPTPIPNVIEDGLGVTVVSPKDGDEYCIGAPIQIVWTAPHDVKINYLSLLWTNSAMPITQLQGNRTEATSSTEYVYVWDQYDRTGRPIRTGVDYSIQISALMGDNTRVNGTSAGIFSIVDCTKPKTKKAVQINGKLFTDQIFNIRFVIPTGMEMADRDIVCTDTNCTDTPKTTTNQDSIRTDINSASSSSHYTLASTYEYEKDFVFDGAIVGNAFMAGENEGCGPECYSALRYSKSPYTGGILSNIDEGNVETWCARKKLTPFTSAHTALSLDECGVYESTAANRHTIYVLHTRAYGDGEALIYFVPLPTIDSGYLVFRYEYTTENAKSPMFFQSRREWYVRETAFSASVVE